MKEQKQGAKRGGGAEHVGRGGELQKLEERRDGEEGGVQQLDGTQSKVHRSQRQRHAPGRDRYFLF